MGPRSLARRSLVYRGIIPLVVPSVGDYRTQLMEAIDHAVKLGLVVTNDKDIGVHALGKDSVMKVLDVHYSVQHAQKRRVRRLPCIFRLQGYNTTTAHCISDISV